ncbi:MAG: monovalent cation/H+ antiporter complex subunit F [Planctomycetota bacterium]
MYGAAALLMLVSMALALVRALKGPTVYDRILAVNMFGTATVLMITTVGFMIGRGDLVDIAIIYALISFTSTLAVLRFTEYEREMSARAAQSAEERT